MKCVVCLISAVFLTACATTNPRIFGGIKTEFKDEKQIVMSYDDAFEIGSILERAYGVASEHCNAFKKKSVMKSKDSSGDFTTIVFECVEE